MKHTIMVFTEIPLPVGGKVLAQTDSDEVLMRLSRMVESSANAKPGQRGAPGRKVIVVSKEPDCKLTLKIGEPFPSALAASAAIGYNYNAVSFALKKVEKSEDKTAIVRGVEFSYADNISVRD